jgi:hypothetical protein
MLEISNSHKKSNNTAARVKVMACGAADTHQHKMKMEVEHSSKTSALVYQTTWTHITDSSA